MSEGRDDLANIAFLFAFMHIIIPIAVAIFAIGFVAGGLVSLIIWLICLFVT